MVGKVVVDFPLVIVVLFSRCFHFVTMTFDGRTDGETDKRTDGFIVAIPRLHSCSAVKSTGLGWTLSWRERNLVSCLCIIVPCFAVNLQHYLMMLSGIITISLLISRSVCLNNDWVATSHIFGTMLFVCGIATLLQATLGSRSDKLPSVSIVSTLTYGRCSSTVSTLFDTDHSA